ncbi:MAG TPA: CDP-alcohol phosphatidyltransferase family protein, partial [Polyangiales bacterium]
VTSARVLLLAALSAASDCGASFGCALAALCIFMLDGLDGFLARRHASVSTFGARYDMEADAGFVLVLTVALFQLARAGLWVVFAGALRYIYVLALALLHRESLPAPQMRRESIEAPRTRFGRHVFALSVIAFMLSLLPSAASQPLSAAATALLAYSFARSFYWSLRARAIGSL